MMKHSFACRFSLLVGLAILLLASNLRAQTDTLAPSNDLATGYTYAGMDFGITGTEYLGAHNFLWGIVTSINSTYNIPEIATYLPFSNVGGGIGAVGGVKLGLALNHWLDLEAKARFLTNYSSRTETANILLDTYHPGNPAPTSNATSSYTLLLSSLDGALLAHIRLNDRFYGIVGGSASQLTKNGFSAQQQSPASYIDLITHTVANVTSQQQPEEEISNWFYGTRFDAEVGIGGVYRIGANNWLLDAELLVGIPFTQWLTKEADSSLNATTLQWKQPAITDPHLWYATLTIGFRLPLEPIPPPIVPPPMASRVEPINITPEAPAINTKTGAIFLHGTVTDATTGKPIQATLTTVNLGNNSVIATSQTDSNGNYSIRVSGPGKYSVTADAPGHLFGSALFEVDSAGRILSNDANIALAATGAGAKTRLLVFFALDKADLEPSSLPELNRARDLMKQVPTMKVEIAGYTDSTGTLAYNMDLSRRRANAVRDYLVGQGIAPDRVTAKGYGPASPIATNTTDEGRAKNRRVEFVVEGQ